MQQASPTASLSIKRCVYNQFLSSIVTSIIKIGRFYQEGFPLQNIKTRHKIKHSEMGQKHFTKTITHPWQVDAKVMKQSKQVLNKLQLQTTKKEGRFGFNTKN